MNDRGAALRLAGILLLIASLMSPLAHGATTIYISSSEGNDANEGLSETDPLASIDEAIDRGYLDDNHTNEGDFPQTIFNHNIYIHSGTRDDVTIENNILSRASSHGVKANAGAALMRNNLIAGNAIAVFWGDHWGDGHPEGVTGDVIDNVVLHGIDLDGEGRGWGMEFSDYSNATIAGNIVAHNDSFRMFAYAYRLRDDHGPVSNILLEDNIAFQWGTDDIILWGEQLEDITIANSNLLHEHDDLEALLRDPYRDLRQYDAIMGGPGTLESFFANARARTPGYDAAQVNDWIRAGFTIPEPATAMILGLSALAVLSRRGR